MDLFPEKLQHTEADPVAVANDDMIFQPPIKRKIAQAPSAPSYKGNLYLSYILFAIKTCSYEAAEITMFI